MPPAHDKSEPTTVLLRLAYDGTDFHGSARDRDVRTVQREVEEALAVLYKQPIETRFASRTDAGVHADGQLAGFEPPFSIPMPGLLLGLSARLPPDVVAVAAWVEQGSVNPRFGNRGKHYRYRIRCTRLRDPIQRRTEWNLGCQLDVESMRIAAAALIGTHDFTSFRAADCRANTTERTLTAVEVDGQSGPVGVITDPGRLDHAKGPDWVEIHVRGTAFLRNMVRILSGTLVEVGLGHRPADSMPELLARGDRPAAGQTAPACGLTLIEVVWPGAPRGDG